MRSDLVARKQIELLESLCGKIDRLETLVVDNAAKTNERFQSIENIVNGIRRQNATIAANTEQLCQSRVAGSGTKEAVNEQRKEENQQTKRVA